MTSAADTQMTSACEFSEGVLGCKYKVEDIIEGNSYKGKLIQNSVVTNVTIQKFRTLEEAQAYIDMLDKLNSYAYFARAKICDESKEPDELPGLAFIEELQPFTEWIRKSKPNMWNYHLGKCLGLGEDFQKVFGDIGKGMQVLNQHHYAHGSLANVGVMFSHDRKIRLVNMDPFSRLVGGSNKVQLFKNDVKDFCGLIYKAIKFDKNTKPWKENRNDLDFFKKICRKLDASSSNDPDEFRKKESDWIYRSFLVWTSDDVFEFISGVNKMLDGNELVLMNYLLKFSGWEQTIRNIKDVTMTNCLNYQLTPQLYTKNYGLIRYIYNYWEHLNGGNIASIQRREPKEAVTAVLRIFPNLIGCAYMEIFLDLKLRCVNYLGVSYAFQEYLLQETQIFS